MIRQVLIAVSIRFSSLSFYMTLGAQIVSGRERHHPGIVTGSTTDMTAQTLYRKIFISLINGFFSNRVGRMGLPFVALAAQTDGNIILLNEQDIIGRMRRMTGRAITAFNRFTQIFVFRILYRPFLQFHRIIMTGATDIELGVI
jgi:hypothetical protein